MQDRGNQSNKTHNVFEDKQMDQFGWSCLSCRGREEDQVGNTVLSLRTKNRMPRNVNLDSESRNLCSSSRLTFSPLCGFKKSLPFPRPQFPHLRIVGKQIKLFKYFSARPFDSVILCFPSKAIGSREVYHSGGETWSQLCSNHEIFKGSSKLGTLLVLKSNRWGDGDVAVVEKQGYIS